MCKEQNGNNKRLSEPESNTPSANAFKCMSNGPSSSNNITTSSLLKQAQEALCVQWSIKQDGGRRNLILCSDSFQFGKIGDAISFLIVQPMTLDLFRVCSITGGRNTNLSFQILLYTVHALPLAIPAAVSVVDLPICNDIFAIDAHPPQSRLADWTDMRLSSIGISLFGSRTTTIARLHRSSSGIHVWFQVRVNHISNTLGLQPSGQHPQVRLLKQLRLTQYAQVSGSRHLPLQPSLLQGIKRIAQCPMI